MTFCRLQTRIFWKIVRHSLSPGFYGKQCAGTCHPLCSVDECDPEYGCNITITEIIQRTETGIKKYLKFYFHLENRFGYKKVSTSNIFFKMFFGRGGVAVA